MSKNIYILVWVVSLSCVCADEGLNSFADFDALRKECFKETGTTEAEFIEAAKNFDVTKISPCYFGCYFKKIGVLNVKGQYDPTIYLRDLKSLMKDNDSIYAQLKDIPVKCENVKDVAVSDGEAGCEMGALVAACFFKEERQIFKDYKRQVGRLSGIIDEHLADEIYSKCVGA